MLLLEELERVHHWYLTGDYPSDPTKTYFDVENNLAKLIATSDLSGIDPVLAARLNDFLVLYAHGLPLDKVRKWHLDNSNDPDIIEMYEIPVSKALRRVMNTWERI